MPATAIVAAKRAAILGTDLPDLKVSLDSLAVLEQTMRHFYIKAMVEQSLGPNADWKAVDAAMLQAAALAKEIAPYKHQRLGNGRASWQGHRGFASPTKSRTRSISSTTSRQFLSN